jgi:hypothetical protein
MDRKTAWPPTWAQMRVTKTLWPPSAGTRRLQADHGAPLVCVRYRMDPAGLRRYTTVELVIDDALVGGKQVDRRVFEVAIAYEEQDLRARAKSLGAKWIPERRLWRLTGAAVKQLDLTTRASRTTPE